MRRGTGRVIKEWNRGEREGEIEGKGREKEKSCRVAGYIMNVGEDEEARKKKKN
jgi:hypothetical protein